MADVRPLHALHYDLGRVGGLQPVAAPPYDVIDASQRAELVARSPYNVVEIDLPQAERSGGEGSARDGGGDPYAHAADVLRGWTADGIVVRDATPALWALAQDYTGPDGRARTRHGVFARVRVEDYGPGRIRPHERTHPGPKEDRLRLTRATRANLSPIFSLYDDPAGAAWGALAPHLDAPPWGEVSDEDGTRHRLWRVEDPSALGAVREALAGVELLIADGHHRYETARVYAQEPGAAPGSDHVLMCLVALQDPGLTVFPTHRLVLGLDDAAKAALREAIERDWDGEPAAELEPASGDSVKIGYYDGDEPRMLTLKDPAIAAAALPDKPDAYRRLDTAVLEALLLEGALGMTEDDISHLNGLDYARTAEQAKARVDAGEADAAFFMAPTPVSQVRDVAATGENMPPSRPISSPRSSRGCCSILWRRVRWP